LSIGHYPFVSDVLSAGKWVMANGQWSMDNRGTSCPSLRSSAHLLLRAAAAFGIMNEALDALDDIGKRRSA
jgi:hypothetical protein